MFGEHHVLVNFMRQLDKAMECTDSWLNRLGMSEGMSGRDENLSCGLSKADGPLPLWVGLIQSVGFLKRSEKVEKG